ncbi:MAG: beta-ketoacyl-[acyl-carrier-protein] synthase family protein [Verrucomicrobiota bacterium]|nr:beta-ketoacyl-[acyl-carrier-protein] synthase family protein [Verrucomicrobiota bacterium]
MQTKIPQSDMESVWITGMGLITSIGNDRTSVTGNLRSLKHGIENALMLQGDESPVKVAGTVKGFEVDSSDPEDWIYPPQYQVPRATLRSFSPHVLYAWCALQQAIEDANLAEEDIKDPESGLYTSSGGSMRSIHKHFEKMDKRGVMACNPLAIVASIAGTLTFNLVAALGVRGSSTGLVSACASSGHALGTALDEIRLGRQKRMLVVGAEDCNFESIVPFCGMRALSLEKNPNMASRPFDVKRNGFVGTGGAVCLVLESKSEAEKRGVSPYARFLGWGQASDGHNVAISHPEGRGLRDAMTNALKDSCIEARDIDYVNAHAPSTSIGDASEMKALKSVFKPPQSVKVSSTKALTGHGLSLSSIMEAAFCCLALKEGFLPGSANVTEPDPELEHLNLLQTSPDIQADRILSNSSGFGGANVSVIFEKV